MVNAFATNLKAELPNGVVWPFLFDFRRTEKEVTLNCSIIVARKVFCVYAIDGSGLITNKDKGLAGEDLAGFA